MAADDDLYLRNTIDGAVEEGLMRSIGGVQELAPWDSITQVHATLADHNDRIIFVLSISFKDRRTFLLGEIEPGWPEIVRAMHDNLPLEPYEQWGPRVLANPKVYELFSRAQT